MLDTTEGVQAPRIVQHAQVVPGVHIVALAEHVEFAMEVLQGEAILLILQKKENLKNQGLPNLIILNQIILKEVNLPHLLPFSLMKSTSILTTDTLPELQQQIFIKSPHQSLK
jgi:hypothetical protein